MPQPGPPRPPSRMRRAFRLLNPIAAGRQVCKPSRPDRVDDPAVKRIQVLRMVVGLAAMVWILVSYRITSDAKSLAYQRFDQILTSAALLAATLPVAVGAFVLASRSHTRRLYLRRALKPLGALLALAGTILYFVLITSGALTGGPFGQMPEKPSTADYMHLMYELFLVLVMLWGFVFVVYGAGLALVHVFRTADIHEVLPPVIAIVLVWELAVADLFSNTFDGVPALVRGAAIFGGPLSVTAVSLWELRRLRTRHGLTLRRALGR
ncbi:hypothetical protein [Streptomyces sp. NBC_00893]|uniref:hypothetical protein n=1 Tax=Streptomyces sp. NBC_00893 TaxID=2975862 RepID=UPI0022530AC2|nr:hypothetical protein [Streptomyces sp. NBC_00893]MCX4848811.1 hypothetical protein [Streptomyces sp. NBC_00893]